MIIQLKRYDKPLQNEWIMEYNYGRNYKHSEGQEWGNGYSNQYSIDINSNTRYPTGNIPKNRYDGGMKQRAKLSEAEKTPIQRISDYIDKSKMCNRTGNIQGSSKNMRELSDMRNEQQISTIPVDNIRKNYFQKITDSEWKNRPSSNLTWPYWELKKNRYEKQLVPWWLANDQQTQKTENFQTFTLNESIPKHKQPFWPGSIGWTGDLGAFGEVPNPPWSH